MSEWFRIGGKWLPVVSEEFTGVSGWFTAENSEFSRVNSRLTLELRQFLL